MIEGKFSKNYLIFLVVGIIGAITAVVSLILGFVFDKLAFALSIVSLVLVFVCAFRFLKLKKQYLKIDSNGLDCYVVAYAKNNSPTKLQTSLNNISDAKVNGSILVLYNTQNRPISIFNLVNANEVASELHKLLSK